MSVKEYFKKKMLIDFILINLIINGIFFFVNFSNPSQALTISIITEDLFIGLILLGALASTAGFVNLKKDMLKGNVELDEYKPHRVHKIFPKNLFARILVLIGLVLLVVFPWFSPFLSIIGIDGIPYVVGFLIKTGSAIIAAIMVGYFVINLVLSDHRSLSL